VPGGMMTWQGPVLVVAVEERLIAPLRGTIAGHAAETNIILEGGNIITIMNIINATKTDNSCRKRNNIFE
jgi:hypothetical protein